MITVRSTLFFSSLFFVCVYVCAFFTRIPQLALPWPAWHNSKRHPYRCCELSHESLIFYIASYQRF